MSGAPERYSFGSFVVDCTERLLLRDGSPVAVREKVFATLECFVRNPGRLLPKEELLETIWPDAHVSEANLNQCVSELRRILGDAQLIQTVPKRGFRFVATVEHARNVPIATPRLRRIAAPAAIAAALVAIIALLLATQHADSRADGSPSVAVVPFRLLGANQADAYLAASLSDTLTTRLGTIARLLVRTGSAGEDPIRAGERLGVGAVVSGSVLPTADRLRITSQIIDVRSRTILWSRWFECTPADLPIIEDALATEVANKLRPGLTAEERSLLTPPHSGDAIANEEYLRGRDLLDRRRFMPESVRYFEHAVARDPNFALAWAALAESLAVPSGVSGSSDVSRAEAAARRAIRLEPSLAEGHAVIGFIDLFHKWDFAAAERELRLATSLRPGSPRFHDWRAFALMTRGDLEGAIREVEKAHEIDPSSGDIAADLALMRFEARDYARAEATARLADSLDASNSRTVLIGSLSRQGRTADALAVIAESDAIPDDDRLLFRELVLATNGDDAARRRVVDFMNRRRREHTPDGNAETLALVGANDLALQWLERAYRDHAFGLIFIGVAPEFDGLRGEPRFRDLVRRVGVVERTPRGGSPES